MISKNALYATIETLIENAAPGDALFEAVSARNITSSVDESVKVVRVECFTGELVNTHESWRKELKVTSTIQCWVSPGVADDSADFETLLDDAMDTSFDMSREIFEGLAANTNLSGTVCDSYFNEFETGEGKLGSQRRGVTYLDGMINNAS